MTEGIFEKINKLPENVQDYVLSADLSDATSEIIAKYGFSDLQRKSFLNVLNQIFFKELAISSLAGVIRSKLDIKDDKNISSLIFDINDKILEPIKDYFGETPVEKQGIKKEFLPLVDKAVKKFGLSFSDEDLKNKFYDITDSFLSGARTKTQFKSSLMKEMGSGGLGWEKEKAGETAEFFASYLRIKEIEKKKEREKEMPLVATPRPVILTPSRVEGKVPGDSSSAFTPSRNNVKENVVLKKADRSDFEHEEREAEKLKSRVANLKDSVPQTATVQKNISEAIKEIDLNFPSSELNERLQNIIDARLRNVRTSVQTFEKLTLDIKNGGMGLSKEDADKVSLVLNKHLGEAGKDLYASSISVIKDLQAKENMEREARENARREQEEKSLNERFKKLTGKEAPLPTPSISEKKEIPTATPLQNNKKIIENKKFVPPAPEKPAFKIPIQPEEAPYFSVKKQSHPKSDAIQNTSEGSRDSSVGYSLRMTQGDGVLKDKKGIAPQRPAVEDIKFTSKLYGPIEEIERMSLDDFRRLSGDPNEVMLKIKDKLSLLRGESFKKYLLGIESWHKSPVYGDYLRILGQSLQSGLPLAEILKSSKTLTQAEFDAIIGNKIE